MDLDFLLVLQNFREGTVNTLFPSMVELSNFTDSFWVFIFLAFFYWIYSTKRGMILWIGFIGSRFILNVAKLIACVYRPWVREPRLKPDADIMKKAAGYSFPSTTAVTATTFFGGLAYWLKNKRKVIAVLLLIVMLLTCFSRLYLSVHTPQDVIVGLLIGVVFVLLAPKIFDYLSSLDFKKSNIVLVILIAVGIAFIVFINVRAYPMDYVDGKILVDPESMKAAGYAGVGEYFGFVIGWWINHNFIHYKIKRTKLCIIVALIAVIPLFYWDSGVTLLFNLFMDKSLAGMVVKMLRLVYIFVIVPLILKRCQNAREISE
ncbi:MAG: phosphatase PAP2 family protein [Coriobacteriia bacterium]|nr:phosphatase PAP2 family protein [Coriobacteriia bacterium]